MCISNTPAWIDWLLILSGPVVLLAINIWFAIAHKRTKNVLLVSILFGVFWAFYWYSQQFLTWCA